MKATPFLLLLAATHLALTAQNRSAPETIPLLEPHPTDPLQSLTRNARSETFRFGARELPLDEPAGQEFHSKIQVDLSPMPELPTAISDAVVYGQVTACRIFLAANKRSLYSEYTLKVGRMLKPFGTVFPGGSIALLRLGGVARVPSGGILHYDVRGYGPAPAIGANYLLFLKSLPQPADAYTIFKFWNIPGLAAAKHRPPARARSWEPSLPLPVRIWSLPEQDARLSTANRWPKSSR